MTCKMGKMQWVFNCAQLYIVLALCCAFNMIGSVSIKNVQTQDLIFLNFIIIDLLFRNSKMSLLNKLMLMQEAGKYCPSFLSIKALCPDQLVIQAASESATSVLDCSRLNHKRATEL